MACCSQAPTAQASPSLYLWTRKTRLCLLTGRPTPGSLSWGTLKRNVIAPRMLTQTHRQ